MNKVQAVMKLQLTDRFSLIYLPFLVLFSSYLINIIISVLLDDTVIYSGGLTSIFVFALIYGIIVILQTFPFALGFSSSRSDYFFGTSFVILGACVFIATVLMGMASLELWSDGWFQHLFFFNIPFLDDGHWLQRWFVLFSLLLHMYFMGTLISTIVKRFGVKVLLSVGVIIFLAGLVWIALMNMNHWWADLFHWLAKYSAFELSLMLCVPSILYVVLFWLFIRKATV